MSENTNDVYQNKFIKNIINNNRLSDPSSIPELQNVAMIYAKDLYDRSVYSDLSPFIKILVFLVRIIHIFGIIFICTGWLLPRKLLIIHVLFCIKTLFLWKLFKDKCCKGLPYYKK